MNLIGAADMTPDVTATVLCPSCHSGPCHDGTLCTGMWRNVIHVLVTQQADPIPCFKPLADDVDLETRHPRYQEAPRSPRPGFRKGRRR